MYMHHLPAFTATLEHASFVVGAVLQSSVFYRTEHQGVRHHHDHSPGQFLNFWLEHADMVRFSGGGPTVFYHELVEGQPFLTVWGHEVLVQG